MLRLCYHPVAMLRSDFKYNLPTDQIAQYPGDKRGDSRLLCLDPAADSLHDCEFREFPQQLNAGDVLVFNDTRVIPARLRGNKASGGKVEVLVERVTSRNQALAHVRASKTPAIGACLFLDGDIVAEVTGRTGDLFNLEFRGDEGVLAALDRCGHAPLPPYIKRSDERLDRERYQTVFARKPGAVAAPTAGLHFDTSLLRQISDMGVETAFVTLHIGTGTFQPVRAERLEDHVMHSEYFEISNETSELINAAHARGSRVVAVGTTVVRTLEASARGNQVLPYAGETDVFITPGYRFRIVDAMLTNFHLPESTLLMLVCAFAGYERTLSAYQHAIAKGYRFYSYGDAMFIAGREPA